jgi:hypothetical protein
MYNGVKKTEVHAAGLERIRLLSKPGFLPLALCHTIWLGPGVGWGKVMSSSSPYCI